MDFVKIITGNPSLKKMLIEKFTSIAKEKGIKKILIDLDKPELDLEEIPNGFILVDENELNYLRSFHSENFNKAIEKK